MVGINTRSMKWATAVTAIVAALCLSAADRADAKTLDGVTFAESQGTLYTPLRAFATELGMETHWDAETGKVYLNGAYVPEDDRRSLMDGTQMIAVRSVSKSANVSVSWDAESQTATVARNDQSVQIHPGKKKVIVNRDAQRLRAYQGDLLILDTPVSTGKPGHGTPVGSYEAGPLKTRMLISRTYNDAKMPYSVQIQGDYVIHGYGSVPDYPASHGCVRMPLTDGNPARWFYQWVNVGTPIVIADNWRAAPTTTTNTGS